jgi:peptide/nickel transport system substrate-binding protein
VIPLKSFVCVAALLCPAAAGAADLTVGLAALATSVDPQFYVGGQNSALVRNMFDGLVNQDEKQRLVPALAVSWKPVDDTTWQFELRPDVKFHDGSAFTAADVVASIKRVTLASTNSPSSFMPYVKDITEVVAVSPLVVRIKTATPLPLLPNNLSRIAILPASLVDTPTDVLNGGTGVIGTGPYRFVSWAPDDRLVVERNPYYWAAKPDWDRVTFRVFKNSSARVAAILSGDVDIIENIPTADYRNVAAEKTLKVTTVAGNRVMYLHLDQGRDESPFAAGPDGKNPLRKLEVRKAMSLAINRPALVDRIMDGQGVPAGQLVPDGYFGWNAALKPDVFDAAAAKALLTKAGYPDGFTLTFHASNDRYPNDAKVAQAVGQMLSRVGIKMSVETMPGSVYFSRASKLEFSMIMGGAAVETGEASSVLGPLLATFTPKTGQGNRGRYSSAAFDAALNGALATVDDAKREDLLRQAMEIGMKDVGVIPLFFLTNSWASKPTVSYAGRADGYTLAADIHAVK